MPAADWRDIHATLLARFGAQHWWPGDTAFEIMVGAVLTQNTAWRNVEAAIARLKAAGRLAPAAMLALPEAELAGLIRAAGYFNVKARRLADLGQGEAAQAGEARGGERMLHHQGGRESDARNSALDRCGRL